MQHNFLEDLHEDVTVNLEHNYFLKRYAYQPSLEGCWVDADRKVITERLFTFIVLHGKVWDNSTYFNLKESEITTAFTVAKQHLDRVKAERKALLTAERAERKKYPTLTQWAFKNVTISAVEEMAYYDRFPGVGEKQVTIYANGLPYRYCIDIKYRQDFELTTEWMFDHISNNYVMRYNVSDMTKYLKTTKFVKTTKHKKVDKNFVPYHFYIGYAVKLQGVQVEVHDAFTGGFEDAKGKKYTVSIDELLNMEVVGEMQGLQAFIPLRNRLKYC